MIQRATHKNRSGLAFAANWHERYTYNDRHELTGADHYTGLHPSGTAVPAEDFSYAYDNIGNRETYVVGAGTGSEEDFYYAGNQGCASTDQVEDASWEVDN